MYVLKNYVRRQAGEADFVEYRSDGIVRRKRNGPIHHISGQNRSWRTGKSAMSAIQDKRNSFDNNGLRTSQGPDLYSKLYNRKAFIEEQLASSFGTNDTLELFSTQRFYSTTDLGHSFWATKQVYGTSPGSLTVWYDKGSSKIYQRYLNHWMVPNVSLPYPPGPWGNGNPLPWGPTRPSQAERLNNAQAMLASARPDKSVSGVGETLYDIFTGNYPKLLTSLGKRIATGKLMNLGVKDVGRYAGDAYLNSVFTWQPIVSDFKSLINLALDMSSVLYDDSFRRKRQTGQVTEQFSFDENTGWAIHGSGYVNGQDLYLYGQQYSAKGKVTYTADSRLSCKISRAVPTPADYDYVKRGMDALKLMGVWTPSLGWDIIPFSFLVDWFLHIGRGFENQSTYGTFGEYKLNYAYATHKSTTLMDYRGLHGNIPMNTLGSTDVAIPAGTVLFTTILRERATPWGFNLDFSKLTSSQWSILAALGLVRVK